MPLLALIDTALPIALAILRVAVVALVGFTLARRGVLHRTALADLSTLIITVTAPCLFFAIAAPGFSGVSLGSATLAVAAAPVLLGLGWVGSAALGKLLRVEPEHWRAVVCAATFQNQSYLPLAVATAVLPPLASLFPPGAASLPASIGGSSVVAISLFGVLYSPLFWGLGLSWLSEAPSDDSRPRVAAWRRLMPPPVVGVLLGYLFGLTPLHLALTPPHAPFHFAFAAVGDIGSLTIPLANLILGGMLANVGARGPMQARDAVATALTKLVLIPGIVLWLLWAARSWWRGDAALSVVAFVIFLEALTPPATNLAVMSSGAAGRASAVIPSLLLVCYTLSLLTMPLWLTLFFHLLRTTQP